MLIALGGVVLAAAMAYQWSSRSEVARQAALSQQQLDLHVRALAQLIDRYRTLPQVLALDPDLRAGVAAPVDEGTRRHLNRRLEEATRTTRASTLTLIDRDGFAVAASNWQQPGSNVGEHYGFRPYVRQALAEGEGRFFGIGVTTGVPGYFLSQAIHDDAGARLGVVVIKIELSVLEQEWLQVDDTVLVSDAVGVVFLSNDARWRYRTLQRLTDAQRQELERTRQYGDQPLLAATLRVQDRPAAEVELVRVEQTAHEGLWLWRQQAISEAGWQVHLLRNVEGSIGLAGRQAALAAALFWLAAVLGVLFLIQRRGLASLRERSRQEIEALVQQHASELRTARDGLLEAAQQADGGLSRQLDHLPQGVVVIDADLRISAWNRRYIDLFRFPADFIRVGRPIQDVFRYNAQRGLLGPGPVEEAIRRRLDHLRSGKAHLRESEKEDGTVLEIRGNPLPDGGFVTSYADITTYKATARELRSLADSLERRIVRRTADLDRARGEAVAANRYKSRFVAAAVHDLLQPLNAARMFLSALRSRLPSGEPGELADHVDGALTAQDAILNSLLDISRLEAGVQPVALEDFALAPLLSALTREFGVLAQDRGLDLVHVPTTLAVRSDPALLRRILQNLLSNAVRYTAHGRIVLGCRREGGKVRIEVWDSGAGIPRARQAEIFEEFRRLDDGGGNDRGAGLGLAIVERIARLLGHRIDLRSEPGRGSVFSVTLPQAHAVAPEKVAEVVSSADEPLPFHDHTVWCIDDDARSNAAAQAMLARWGCRVEVAGDADAALAAARPGQPPSLLLLDRHLGEHDGAGVFARLAGIWGASPPVILLTGDRGPEARGQAAEHGWHYLAKPVRPPSLRALMSQLLLRST